MIVFQMYAQSRVSPKENWFGSYRKSELKNNIYIKSENKETVTDPENLMILAQSKYNVYLFLKSIQNLEYFRTLK